MTAHQDDMADQALQPGNHGQRDGAELPKKAPDFLELLLQAIVDRVKLALQKDLQAMVDDSTDRAVKEISADRIDGLDRYIDYAIEEHDRNGRKIDADDVDNLDEYIRETIKRASISIDF